MVAPVHIYDVAGVFIYFQHRPVPEQQQQLGHLLKSGSGSRRGALEKEGVLCLMELPS